MSAITPIYSSGKLAGYYNNDPDAGQCLPIESKPSAPAAKAEGGWLERTLRAMFINTGASAAACGGETGKVEADIGDGGIPFVAPDAEITVTTPSGEIVTLPTNEEGEIQLPDDIWFAIEGSGAFFQETPAVPLTSSQLIGQNLQKLNLQVVLGSDSTSIEGLPAGACFDGMINTNTPDLAAEDVPCPETGYENFVACPSNPANRLKVYLAGYRLEAFDVQGNPLPDGARTMTLTDVQELYVDPASGTVLGVVCDGADQPLPYSIEIPREYHGDGNLSLKLTFQLVVDAREADRNANYQTWLGVRIQETP